MEPIDNPEIKKEFPESGAAAATMPEYQDISDDTNIKDEDMMSKEEELEPIVQT